MPRPLRRLRLRSLRLQLRARITLVFAVGALALSVLVATTTFFEARSAILGQAVASAELSAEANVALFQTDLANASSGITPEFALLNIDNNGGDIRGASVWYPAQGPPINDLTLLQLHVPPINLGVADLPPSLVKLARGGTPAEQVFGLDGARFIGVGIPSTGQTTATSGTYVDVFTTDQVNRTLQQVVAGLLIASLVTIVLGAVLGRWAAQRVLRPLRDAARVAASIASGDLDSRITTGDASDLAALSSSFNQMVDRLQERIAREVHFSSDVAHELRSPLTTLATALSVVAARREELSPPGREALDLLTAEVRRFQLLVTDLLEISLVDARADRFEESLTEVQPLLERALVAAGAGDVPVSMAPDVGARWILVDKRRFGRVIANITENATRYAYGVVGVFVEADGEVVRIAIDDDGPGVPEEDRERIFDRFARGAQAGSRGRGSGSGLGLALVSEHVRVHSGKVWVETAPGGGARFVVELPLAPPELALAAASEELADDPPPEPESPPEDLPIDPEWPGP
jgi:signal transduction histidine kinase